MKLYKHKITIWTTEPLSVQNLCENIIDDVDEDLERAGIIGAIATEGTREGVDRPGLDPEFTRARSDFEKNFGKVFDE